MVQVLALVLAGASHNVALCGPPLCNASIQVDDHSMVDPRSLPLLTLPHPTNMFNACPMVEKVEFGFVCKHDMVLAPREVV